MRRRALPALASSIASIASIACCGLLVPASAMAAVAGHFSTVLDTPATITDPSLTAQRNSYVVLQAWETERASELKAANPSLMVLAYQNLSAMAQGTGPEGLSSSGVNYAEANTAHPDWFLQESDGARIAEEGYSWLWMADIGSPSYQQQWTANVLRLLRSGPWDGVMMDDTNTTARYHVYPASRIAKYPTDAAYQAAVRSMLAYAGPKITAAGKLAIPNMGAWSEYPEVVREWLPYVSGGADEMFAKWSAVPGEGYRDESGWRTQLEEIHTTEALGKTFLAVTQAEPSDTRAVRYGWASVLLAADGHASYLAADGYDGETWSSEYEVPLGEPTAAAREVAGGAWERTFSDGLVVVNPSAGPLAVALGGVYSGDGLSEATQATLPADSALILTGAANESGAPESSPAPEDPSSAPGEEASGQLGASEPIVNPPFPPAAASGVARAGGGELNWRPRRRAARTASRRRRSSPRASTRGRSARVRRGPSPRARARR